MLRKLALVILLLVSPVKAQSLSLGGGAGITTWNATFTQLQTPGWTTSYHPVGLVDIQYKNFYATLGGDPHAYKEASTWEVGIRLNLLSKGRHTLYAQGSVGEMLAPSFLEYCGSYEYKNGDCGAGGHQPEYCWWFSTNAGLGYRIRVDKDWEVEVAKFEYLNPYAIGPRYRISTGFRYYFK